MHMPEPDQTTLAKRDAIIARLRRIVPGEGVIADADELRAYECDGLSAYRAVPMAVVLPSTTREVSAILKLCDAEQVKVVPRGAGTSLSGGALPLTDGIVLGLGKFNRILEIDFENRCVVAQPGVTNLGITHAVEHEGFYYAPDPSSQIACTIGGNVAENSGGVHCLKYGLTANNILGLEMVLPNGDVVRLGGKHLDAERLRSARPDDRLRGPARRGHRGHRAHPEEARVCARAADGLSETEQAGDCVAAIIGNGIIPGGLEMMDRPAIVAAEDFCHPGYPLDVEGLLICELDGPEAEVAAPDRGGRRDRPPVRRHGRPGQRGRGRAAALLARAQVRVPGGRPDLAGLLLHGRHHPARASCRSCFRACARCRERYGLRVANVFHAGDGNLHPLILYDANQPGQLERTEEFGAEILKLCVEVGGVLTGEHGVGVEKRDLMPVMFNEDDLNQQQRVKCAFDPDPDPQPGQGLPPAPPLRRARPPPRPPRPAPLPRPAAVLSAASGPDRRGGQDRDAHEGSSSSRSRSPVMIRSARPLTGDLQELVVTGIAAGADHPTTGSSRRVRPRRRMNSCRSAMDR